MIADDGISVFGDCNLCQFFSLIFDPSTNLYPLLCSFQLFSVLYFVLNGALPDPMAKSFGILTISCITMETTKV